MTVPDTSILPAFADLTRQVRELLAPMAQRQIFAAGTQLWREGDQDGMLLALDRGRVKITRALPNGRPVTIFLFGPGDVFGFMPLLDGRPYPATASVIESVEGLVVRRQALIEAFREDPQLAMALLALLARRLREAFERIELDSGAEVMPRVAAALHSLVEQQGEAGRLTVIDLPVPSGDLAGVLGIAPESLSRAITRLVASGVLHRLGPRRLQVLDPARLSAASRRS